MRFTLSQTSKTGKLRHFIEMPAYVIDLKLGWA
jgi:hypothetical protein